MRGQDTTRDDVLAAVDEEFRADPLSEITWDDPYPQRLLPGRDAPEDAYSRVSEPARHRIVGARARAWERALERLGLGDAESAAVPTSWTFQSEHPRARAVVPRRADAQPLILVAGALEGVAEAVVAVGMGDPRGGSGPVLLDWVPDCGCDACDSGSADLLAALDQQILTVVGGMVHVRGGRGRRRWVAWGTPSGARASGLGIPRDISRVLDDARAGQAPRGCEVLRGEPWWRG
ncbi:DUF6226 family protein [Nesterenkonia sp. HG001]|uniref:DUF6226 family protein n=1 Tax=Nesterenkonia sp. HG001 TaxID=2983207 RepID=UPI002AC4154F|nr:DUF6226 family protein [Nesterenkonia sp. HG001]MDZ5078240.1 DUF6226 family protein [Nesterenkonia sp. HG001]